MCSGSNRKHPPAHKLLPFNVWTYPDSDGFVLYVFLPLCLSAICSLSADTFLSSSSTASLLSPGAPARHKLRHLSAAFFMPANSEEESRDLSCRRKETSEHQGLVPRQFRHTCLSELIPAWVALYEHPWVINIGCNKKRSNNTFSFPLTANKVVPAGIILF